jgi:DUF971 family protein
METASPDYPETVRVIAGGGEVRLAWAGRAARVSASVLREACRCAWCTRARRKGEAVGSADAITGFEPMGGEAVHIVFSDGHRTGVFPWDYISQLASTEPTP